MDLLWQSWHHSELDTRTLYAILALRNRVFIIEQHCLYQDVDGNDLKNDHRHITAFKNQELIAYARILTHDQGVSIGRVIISEQARGYKLGQQLMTRTLADCHAFWPGQKISLSAQAHLQDFYRRSGFTATTDVYDEDGIPHIGMTYRPL